MPSTIQLFDKGAFLTIELESPTEQRSLARVLGDASIPNEETMLRELALVLNPTSFRKVVRRVLESKPNVIYSNSAKTFQSAFSSEPIFDIPASQNLNILMENINFHAPMVNLTTEMLKKFQAEVISKSENVVEPISRMVEVCGFSRIALLKLFQLEVLSYKLSDADNRLRHSIYSAGKVRDLSDILMIIDQTIQPRGRPFRTMLAYSQQIDFGASYYAKIRGEISDLFCPFPIMEDQTADFVQTLTGFSISDQAVGLLGLYNIAHTKGWGIAKKIRSGASEAIKALLDRRADEIAEKKFLSVILNDEHTDYDIYNAAVANRDFQSTSIFRNYADELLLPKISRSTKQLPAPTAQHHLKAGKKSELSERTLTVSGFICKTCNPKRHALSYLLRFLNFRKTWPTDYEFSHDALLVVVESGMPLHRIIDDSEIEKMVLSAPQVNGHLSALILRHFPTVREFSEDSDYLFLRALEESAITDCDGDIVAFIDKLSNKYPKFVVSLISTLTPRRLQKCYMCITNYPQVSLCHRKLLEVAARTTGDIDLIIQADQIALDEKLALVRAQFDSSRIFVDEVLFKNWASEEIVPTLLALRKHVFLYSPALPENPTVEEISASVKTGALAKIASILKEHFANLPIREAFQRFCLDHYFGVDSFLGRRIRHNATHGVLLGQMEKLCLAAIEKDPHAAEELRASFDSWKAEFLQVVNTLVADCFRFKTDEFPKGLLNLAFESSPERFDQLETDLIIQTIASSKSEAIVQSMMNGFWGLLKPELKRVRTYLRTDFKQHALELLDTHFQDRSGPVVGLAADLRSTLLERIERLSGWYTPYSPVEITIGLADLARMVWSDVEEFNGKDKMEIEGNASNTLVTGGGVRTLFDCLHVVLVNASKHSVGMQNVELKFNVENSNQTGVQDLNVRLLSSLSDTGPDRDRSEKHFERMNEAIRRSEVSEKVMVMQGYSGLPKLKYLLFRNQRMDSLSLKWVDGRAELAFSIPVNFPGGIADAGSD